MASMMELLREVYPLPAAPVSPGTDAAITLYKRELPFTVHEYASGSEFNGWVLPDNWRPLKAEIRKDGRLIHDGMAHPLGVWGYSQSFRGKVGLDELKAHLAFSTQWEDALVYYGDLYYKLGRKDWGFSVPQRLFRSLQPGEYEVELITEHKPGTLKVLDYFLPGRSPKTIVLNAHNCHAAQANDDTSGCVVGVELMKRLAKRDNEYSWRLIICPELYGTLFWLKGLPLEERRNLAWAVMLKSVGNREALSLQKTFRGDTLLDRAAVHYFRGRHPGGRIGAFRTLYGNDETVFEAPGFEIPSISITRYPTDRKSPGRYPVPYPEYHTSMDDDRQILEAHLEEAVAAVLGVGEILEQDRAMRRRFEGLLCLSNPKYDLYQRTWDPANAKGPGHGETDDWHYLMNCVMRYFDGKTTVLDIAERHQLPFHAVLAYLRRFADKGLIDFIPSEGT